MQGHLYLLNYFREATKKVIILLARLAAATKKKIFCSQSKIKHILL